MAESPSAERGAVPEFIGLPDCAVRPALAVVVMPEDMLCQFILLAAQTQIIKPKMNYFDQEHWSGKWQKVYVYPKLGFRSWEPDMKRKGK